MHILEADQIVFQDGAVLLDLGEGRAAVVLTLQYDDLVKLVFERLNASVCIATLEPMNE